jgi:hypothetical protein
LFESNANESYNNSIHLSRVLSPVVYLTLSFLKDRSPVLLIILSSIFGVPGDGVLFSLKEIKLGEGDFSRLIVDLSIGCGLIKPPSSLTVLLVTELVLMTELVFGELIVFDGSLC